FSVDCIAVGMTRDPVYSLGAGVLHVFDHRRQQLAHALRTSFALRRSWGRAFSPFAIGDFGVLLIANRDHFRIAERTIGPIGVRTIDGGEIDHARTLGYFAAVGVAGHGLSQAKRISGLELLERVAQVLARVVRWNEGRPCTRRAAF